MTTDPASPVSASDLLRSLGLLVDGPARWGSPVSGRAAGVFVVELPGGADAPPIDVVALRRWIETVPSLMLDGERPTPQELARWLTDFWLPGESILYVGRSAKSVGRRVSSMYETVLGDAQPYSGGHWLKTLAALSELRVWWAETDAYEEYEDALLTAVAERSGGRLPFANLGATDGRAKVHGLAGSLKTGASAAPAPVSRTSRTRSTPATTRARTGTSRAAAKKTTRPAGQPTYVSRDGLVKLNSELDELRSNVRPQVIARVKAARELGDLKENGDYEYARKEQSFVEGRILALEAMIKSSVLIDEAEAGPAGRAALGSSVVVHIDDVDETYLLVGPAEADPARGKISYVSPVGRALLGAHAGDEVTVQLPSGSIVYRVVEVR